MEQVEDELLSLVRQRAGEPGFFRACLGSEQADAMASGAMDDEATMQAAYVVTEAVQELSLRK